MQLEESSLIKVGDVVRVKLVTANIAYVCAQITTEGPSHLGKEFLVNLEKEAKPGLVIKCWDIMADIRVSGKTYRLEKWNLEKI